MADAPSSPGAEARDRFVVPIPSAPPSSCSELVKILARQLADEDHQAEAFFPPARPRAWEAGHGDAAPAMPRKPRPVQGNGRPRHKLQPDRT